MSVSIVVPTYLRPLDLEELFDSILIQTIKPSEVIVVDDTPGDAIELVCRKYGELFNKFGINLIYARNPGQPSAAASRNIGVKLARGELIMFLDSDVVIFPDYIEKITDVFKKYPHALGVQGWIVNVIGKKFHTPLQIFYGMFFLEHYTRNSCRLWEYPIMLSGIINCKRLSGANMTFKRCIFNEFQFDENLKRYSYMEDVLLSHLIFKKYPNSLFMTPYARCIHKRSESGRMKGKEFEKFKNQYRKYVLTKLFGVKGTFIYFWQSIGIMLVNLKARIASLKNKNRSAL